MDDVASRDVFVQIGYMNQGTLSTPSWSVYLCALRRSQGDRWPQAMLSQEAYLRRAAVNASLDLLRARSRAASVPIDDMLYEIEERSEAGPERRRHDAEMRRRLRQAIALLSDKSARIFILRYLEECDNKEIAKMLGMSQTAVAVVLHRARHKVREQLGEFIGGIES